MNIVLNPTATAQAIQTAIKNADKAEQKSYLVEKAGEFCGVDVWNVFKPGSDLRGFPDYYVSAHADGATCTCEQGKQFGYCKHIELCARVEAWEASVEAHAEEYDLNEDGRFFMMECLAESLAETAGAWY